MEQVAVSASGKCVRRYSPEHPFFAAGNALRALKYRQDGASDEDDDGGKDDERDVFQCRLITCNVGFRSVAAYEEHYDLEMHDAFFKVLSKKKPMYACLVDGCEENFTHDDKRNRHLVQVHQYPAGFSFHRPRRVQSKVSKSKQIEKKKRPRKKKERGNKNQMEVDQAAEPTEETQEDTISMRTIKPEASAESSDLTSEGPEDQSTKDIDMLEELEESMRNLRIPKTLSFGRKQRRRR